MAGLPVRGRVEGRTVVARGWRLGRSSAAAEQPHGFDERDGEEQHAGNERGHKDSLYIFIETTANITDANPTDFLYTDQIQFDSGKNLQKVELVTLIQDAVFLYPKRFSDGTTETLPTDDGKKIDGFYLDENDPINGNELKFTNKKAYVIYGYAAVPEGKLVSF